MYKMLRISMTTLVTSHACLNKVSSTFFLHGWLPKRAIHVSTCLRSIVDKEKATKQWGSSKQTRKIKLNFALETSDPKINKILSPLRAAVQKQGDFVRQLKANQAPELDIKNAVSELKSRKKQLEEKEYELALPAATFDRAKMEDVLKQRFFYDQSFSIYGGVSGQFDYGPMGCAMKINLLNAWRQHFVLEEQMLEVDCSILTPEKVLKASGHVDKFADWVVKDLVSGEFFRLDHLIKNSLEKLSSAPKATNEVKDDCFKLLRKIDGMSIEEMTNILQRFDIKSPTTGNNLSEPTECNLMFSTQISNTVKGYLRPETAQGIFTNFQRLLQFNSGKLPFAAAQIGNAFRNEISTRAGLIRVREFTMAEIEHFCDPQEKNHPKFGSVKDQVMLLYSAANQMDGKSATQVTIGEAVKTGLVGNETLGYFMARIQQYLLKVGILPDRLRFRQHMNNELAHYACDCWDAECLTSYGWIECVGCADRSAYDLTQHTNATGVKLTAEKLLREPKIVKFNSIIPNPRVIGQHFKSQSQAIIEYLCSLQQNSIQELQKAIDTDGFCDIYVNEKEIRLQKEMVSFVCEEKPVSVEEITPCVIEPSFGIGRILYALLEQNFKVREGKEYRPYFSLPPSIAPIKCSVLPLVHNSGFEPVIKEISHALTRNNVYHKIDDGKISIGRRYTRTDELAIPFGITIDFETLQKPHTVTLRDRDSTEQRRVPVDDIAKVVKDLSEETITWNDIASKYFKTNKKETFESAT